MKVALVHDWLTGLRGGEKALEVFCEIFPDADLFTLVHVPGQHVTHHRAAPRRRASPIQWLPMAGRLYRQYLPLFPFAVEQFDLDGYDLVLSTSHCAAKSVVVTGRARHLCYCLTPMRYAWDQFDAYFGPERVGPLMSGVLRPVMAGLARWDRATAGRVHRYLAISQYVARRIALYYNRESTLVYPPVDTVFYAPAPDTDPGTVPSATRPTFLVVSALVPYKRVDLAMMAAKQAGVGLTIVGDGPERARLDALAGDGVELLGRRTDEEIRTLYRTSTATILPGEEDFGIVPVEAQACGRPVVALGRGGALDTVIDGETGILVADSSVEALADGLRRAAAMAWDGAASARTPSGSRATRFVADVHRVVDDTLAAPRGAPMVRRHNRLLVAFHIATDAVLGMVAFLLAYVLRFDTGLIAITKGHPPIEQYLNVLPFIALVVPLGFHLQGLYRLRRGRSRIDDFFNVLVGSIFAVVLGVVEHALLPGLLRARRAEGSRRVRGIAAGLGALPRPQHRIRLPVAQVHPRGARAPLDRRRRPAPDPDCGRGRPRPRRRGPHPRAPRARATRSSGSWTTRPAAITSAIAASRCSARSATPPTSWRGRRSTTSTWRCRSRST